MPDYIDLHLHTTASDGSLTPAAVVGLARERGLKAIAVTDHDTIAGCPEAHAAGSRLGVEVICGVEISADWPQGTLHMLGYFFGSFPRSLDQGLKELQDNRVKRNLEMIVKLQNLGFAVSEDDIVRASGGGQIGRPHFAKVLVEKKYVKSMEAAFDRYLGKGKPAYVEKDRLTPEEALQMIAKSGGIPVLAHPTTLGEYDSGELPQLLSRLQENGLRGIEVYYYSHTEPDTNRLLSLAQRFNLLVTGGTDFHGANLGEIQIGTGKGNLKIPYQLLMKLKNVGGLHPQT
jgi:predicted metal-dependent phosphoesterase TrpH